MKKPSELAAMATRWLAKPRVSWVLVPLIVLAVDLLKFPYLFHTEKLADVPSRSQLIAGERRTVGWLRGHRLAVSADDLRNEDYFVHIGGRSSGLVFAHHIGPARVSSRTGPLGRALQKRLEEESQAVANEFENLLKDSPISREGSVLELDLNKSTDALPLTFLFAVLLPEDGDSDAILGAVKSGLKAAVTAASEHALDHLIVGGLAVDPRLPGHLKYAEFLDALAAALPMGGQPGTVHLSFYSGTPSSELSRALTATREHLDHLLSGDWPNRLAGSVRRPLLLLTAVCLLVVSLFIPLTARNALIVGIVYITVAGGASETFQAFFDGYSASVLFISGLIIQCAFAIGLIWIVHWDPKEILKKGGRQDAIS